MNNTIFYAVEYNKIMKGMKQYWRANFVLI
jgi:hypothetical protein